MKVVKWILFSVLTVASVAAGVYAVLHRAELCGDCVAKFLDKIKSFFRTFKEQYLTEDDFCEIADCHCTEE